MRKLIIVSDFDGTITKEDSLYNFFKTFAPPQWLDIEQRWVENKIDSKECLKLEFDSVENLNEKLIDDYIDTIELDEYFSDFYKYIKKNNIDFLIVSDGIDYFINKILSKNKINDVKVISNHGEFINGKFMLSFPNSNSNCKKNSGTCKCSVIEALKKDYEKIAYIGDGFSDLCCANKVNILFAKSHLLAYCIENNIDCVAYQNYKGVINYDFIR